MKRVDFSKYPWTKKQADDGVEQEGDQRFEQIGYVAGQAPFLRGP
jgi:hypothetical protein